MKENQNFIGVGGILKHNDKYLLVKHTYGEYNNLWIIPGGYVKPGEHLDTAITREFHEETGLTVKTKEIIAVRSRQRSTECLDCYIVFRLEYISGEASSDNFENDAAEFFTYDEIQSIHNIVPLSKILIQKLHENELKGMQFTTAMAPYTEGNEKLKLFL